jgi:hypothetical protein
MDDKERKETPEPPEKRFIGLPKKISALLASESDRGAILIVAAYLDEILGLLIRAACVSDKIGEAILQHRQPAGDFSSRITLCEAFGLIDHEEVAGLTFVRKIRNQAAHFDQKGRGFDVLFDSSGTISQIRELAKVFRTVMKSEKPADVRALFIALARLIATRLYVRLFEQKRAPTPMTMKEKANVIREAFAGTPFEEHIRSIDEAAKAGKVKDATGNLEKLAEAIQSILEQRSKGENTVPDKSKLKSEK